LIKRVIENAENHKNYRSKLRKHDVTQNGSWLKIFGNSLVGVKKYLICKKNLPQNFNRITKSLSGSPWTAQTHFGLGVECRT